MSKIPFTTKEKLEEIAKVYPTPFHLYDEAGIRKNAENLKKAFAWNKGFKEYFAVKATPNPFLINILREYGCGCDCSSVTELMLSKAIGATGDDIMFSSNDTPPAEFKYADDLGAIINLDDITHIDILEKTLGYLPKKLSCRYNPGGYFSIANNIMDNPGDAKYGMTTEQLFEAFKIMKSKGVEEFGIHAFLIQLLMSIIQHLQKLFLKLRLSLKKKQVHISSLLTFQVVSVFLIVLTKKAMISLQLVQVLKRFITKFLYQQEWMMLQSLQSLVDLC